MPDDLETNRQAFSATNVGVWYGTVGVECGDPGAAVAEKARRVDERPRAGASFTDTAYRHAAALITPRAAREW